MSKEVDVLAKSPARWARVVVFFDAFLACDRVVTKHLSFRVRFISL